MHKCKTGMQSFILARISDFKLQEIKDKSNTIKEKKKSLNKYSRLVFHTNSH